MENIMDTSGADNLRQTGLEDTQAQALASRIPPWSRIATKADLEIQMSNLQDSLIRWMVRIFLTFLTVIGSLIFGLLSWLGNAAG